MKRNIFILFLLFCALHVFVFAKAFKSATNLVKNYSPKQTTAFFDKTKLPPFLAVYQKKGSTLVLLAANHGPKSLHIVQYAFDKYSPNISLIEREKGFPLNGCEKWEDSYTAALSAKNNIPLVRMDADFEEQWEYAKKHGFSYDDFQMFYIIRHANGVARHEGKQPNAVQEIREYEKTVHNQKWGKLFTEESLLSYFKKHYRRNFNTTDFTSFYLDLIEMSPKKWVRKTPFYKIMHGQPDVRSIFMLENITAALNQYQVVFSEMGSGHFFDIHKALEKMLGKPYYITYDQILPQNLWRDCKLDGLKEVVLIP